MPSKRYALVDTFAYFSYHNLDHYFICTNIWVRPAKSLLCRSLYPCLFRSLTYVISSLPFSLSFWVMWLFLDMASEYRVSRGPFEHQIYMAYSSPRTVLIQMTTCWRGFYSKLLGCSHVLVVILSNKLVMVLKHTYSLAV